MVTLSAHGHLYGVSGWSVTESADENVTPTMEMK
jgi:hypothetical protein